MTCEKKRRIMSVRKAEAQQQYAMLALLVITGLNVMFGCLMVAKILPVWLGMILAFGAMTVIILKAQRDLLDDDESMWETPKEFHERMHRKND